MLPRQTHSMGIMATHSGGMTYARKGRTPAQNLKHGRETPQRYHVDIRK